TVRHDPRRAGRSRYRLAALVRLNLDLITSFTTVPLALLGVLSVLAGAVGAGGAVWCVATGRPRGFSAGFFPVPARPGGVFFATAVLGLYLARIYRTVAGARLGYVVRATRADEDPRASE